MNISNNATAGEISPNPSLCELEGVDVLQEKTLVEIYKTLLCIKIANEDPILAQKLINEQPFSQVEKDKLNLLSSAFTRFDRE